MRRFVFWSWNILIVVAFVFYGYVFTVFARNVVAFANHAELSIANTQKAANNYFIYNLEDGLKIEARVKALEKLAGIHSKDLKFVK